MVDVVALGEVLIDFASRGIDANGYPMMQALPGVHLPISWRP